MEKGEKAHRKQLIDNIVKNKRINKKLLKYANTTLLEKLDRMENSVFEKDSLYFYNKENVDKAIHNCFYKNGKMKISHALIRGISYAILGVAIFIEFLALQAFSALFLPGIFLVISGICLPLGIKKQKKLNEEIKDDVEDVINKYIVPTVNMHTAITNNNKIEIENIKNAYEQFKTKKQLTDERKKQEEIAYIFGLEQKDNTSDVLQRDNTVEQKNPTRKR